MAELHDRTPDDLRLLDALRRVTPEDHDRPAPPESVWDAIAARVAEPEPVVAPGPVHHPRIRHRVALVAIATAAAAAAATILVARPSERSDVVARAALTSDGLEAAPVGLTGRAEVRERDGERVLHLDLDGVRPTSGEYLELWLLKEDVSGMVSLGTARPDGDYDLPDGLNVADYPVVDVSTEPYDGDPTHSGASLVRGLLDA